VKRQVQELTASSQLATPSVSYPQRLHTLTCPLPLCPPLFPSPPPPPSSPQDQWDTVKRQVQELTASSQCSNQPAIYGMVAGAEAARLRGEVPTTEGECAFRACSSPLVVCAVGIVLGMGLFLLS
jgi:hypothetical protein